MAQATLTKMVDVDSNWRQRQLDRVTAQKRAIYGNGGRLEKPLAYQLECSGKYFRPFILIAFSMLSPRLREPDEDVIATSAAIEALHECSLIHDDIIDHTYTRRGRNALASQFTVRTASYAGAYIAARGIEVLAESCRHANIAIDLTSLRRFAEAQIVEILPPAMTGSDQARRNREIVLGKTGVLIRLAAKIGAGFAASRSHLLVPDQKLDVFADSLALAYQIRDDVLDLEDDERLRRPGGNDVREGRLSWPVMLWLFSQRDAAAVSHSFRYGTMDPSSIYRLRKSILQSGVGETAKATVAFQLNRAQSIVELLPRSVGSNLLLHVISRLRMS